MAAAQSKHVRKVGFFEEQLARQLVVFLVERAARYKDLNAHGAILTGDDAGAEMPLPASLTRYPMSYNPPPKGRFEYYSPDGKYLGEWGSGPFAGFRALLDSEYDTVLANQKRIDAMRDDWDPGMGPENRDPFVQPDPGWTKPLIGPIGWAMFDASKPIQ